MRFSADGGQLVLQVEQCRARMTYHLTSVANQSDFIQLKRADDHQGLVIIVTVWNRTACQTGVGGLHDDRNVCGDADL